MFVVKYFCGAGEPRKLNTQILEYNMHFVCFSFVGCHKPRKYFNTKISHTKNLTQNFSKIHKNSTWKFPKIHKNSTQKCPKIRKIQHKNFPKYAKIQHRNFSKYAKIQHRNFSKYAKIQHGNFPNYGFRKLIQTSNAHTCTCTCISLPLFGNAVVLVLATSDPPLTSLTPKQARMSPAIDGAKYCCFSSSLPNLVKAGVAISEYMKQYTNGTH